MSETIEKTFNVSSPAKLEICNIRGSVDIHRGEDSVIQVTAVKQPNSGDEKNTVIEITQNADGKVRAVTRFPDGSWNWLFGSHPSEVNYLVTAPQQCSITLKGVSNSVRVEGIEGDASVNSVSGDIELRNLKGSMRIHTVSGDVEGDQISGTLDLVTVSGDTVLRQSALSSIKANSISGDVQIFTPLNEGPYNFRSVSGQVHLTVPADSKCTGELHTVSGDLESAFPNTSYSRHHGRQMVQVQGGGVIISLRSVSGDLILDTDGEIPPAAEPGRTSTMEERRAVLD